MAATQAADATVTLTGEAKCAKCSLKETDACQNVVITEDAGKKVTYYFAKNKASDDFHKEVCTATKKVKAVGTVKEEGGKKMLTLEKIELVK